MAYIFDPNLDDQQQQQMPQPGGPVGATGSQPVNQSSQPNQPRQRSGSSGQFTNLQKYISANEGQNLGQKVSGKVGEEVSGAKAAQDSAQADFSSRVADNTVNYDQQLASRAKTDAVGVRDDAGQKAAFQRMAGGQYQGPNQLSDLSEQYLGAQSKTQAAQQASGLGTTEQGQRSLLERYYNRPTYSGGEKNLDQLLVKGDRAGQQQLLAQQQEGAQLSNRFQNIQDLLANQAQQARQTSQETAQRLQNEFLGDQGYLPQQLAQLQQRASDLDQQTKSNIANLGARLRSGEGPQALRGRRMLDIDPAQFISQTGSPTASSAATQQEAANYQALNDLLNRVNTDIDVGQAGTFNPNSAYNLDLNRLLGALDTRQAQVIDRKNEIGSEISNLRNRAKSGSGTFDYKTEDVYDPIAGINKQFRIGSDADQARKLFEESLNLRNILDKGYYR
jgi:hypothetical protein